MKKVAAVLLMGVLTSSYALGATVMFTPEKLNLAPGEAGSFDLTVVPDNLRNDTQALAWDALVLVAGSDTLDLAQLVVSDGFIALAGATLQGPFPAPPGDYVQGWAFGGFFGGGPIKTPADFVVATIDVQVPMGAMLGESLIVEVNTANETNELSRVTLAGVNETLAGMGTVNVVPEPATIGLVGLGALALIRRRKSA